ncbi:MAG: tol-pal system-associated acyl-CoA thioesterase [Nitrospirota bacterium]
MKIKIYYEDTDAGGVVYYANYLRFMERARTELLSEKGIDVAAYHDRGFFFPVVHVEIDYKRPAKLGDVIDIVTEVLEIKNATILLKQDARRDDTLLAAASVRLACINKDGKPQRLPESFKGLAP